MGVWEEWEKGSFYKSVKKKKKEDRGGAEGKKGQHANQDGGQKSSTLTHVTFVVHHQ